MDIEKIISDYKNHTLSFIANKYNLTKHELKKLLIKNNVTLHTPEDTIKFSRIENPTQGTVGKVYYNNGVIQGMYIPGSEPNGWQRGGLSFSKEKTDNMLSKRGYNSPMQTEIGHNNYYTSILNKYGVDNIAKTDQAKKNTVATNNKKYGVDYVMQNPDVKAKAQKKPVWINMVR